MATPYNVQLFQDASPGDVHFGEQSQASAMKVSELLMLNHEKYHALFNEVGLHNHIVHHLLSLWALGATPSEIQAAYDLNEGYQRSQQAHKEGTSIEMKNEAFFNAHLQSSDKSDIKFYSDYLKFFQDIISEKGARQVLEEFVFKGDERADDILGRMYSGFEHPIIHLGFGIEFQQPCIIAEALASACTHDKWPLPVLSATEKYLRSHTQVARNPLLSVLDALKSDPAISTAVKPSDPQDRVNFGLLKRVTPDQLAPYFAQWRVEPTSESIAYHTAEMAHACVFVSGATQHPQKQPRMDFFLMHSTNVSVFYPTFMAQGWLSLKQRARLLTLKGWMDLLLYAASGCPTLYSERISGYVPKQPGPWDGVIQRARRYPDDGHVSKLMRAILNAERVSAAYTGKAEFPLRQRDFLQVAHMTMDSVEVMLKPGYQLPEGIRNAYIETYKMDEEVAKIVARFVRWCGVEGAWDDFPDLEIGGRDGERGGSVDAARL